MSNFDDIFEPAPQAEDFDKEAWAAKKKAERDEVYALADATAEEVCADGGKFRDYLNVQANFRHYSATNALLILATKPDAADWATRIFGAIRACISRGRNLAVLSKSWNPTASTPVTTAVSAFPTTLSVCMTFRRLLPA